MKNRILMAVIGVAVFVAVVAIGLVIVGNSDTAAKVAPSPTASTLAPSPSTSTPAVETTQAPTSTLPVITPIEVSCGGNYTEREALPLTPCVEGLGVSKMQEALIGFGYSIDADGYYGPGTARAVQEFQADAGLPPTGTCDAATWLAIVGEQPGFDLDGDGVIGPNEIAYD